MRKINDIRYKLIITAAVIFFAVLMYIFKIPCIILSVTGIPCFGCGMTRALVAALKLDFTSAFSYHGMFWSLPILYLMFLFDGKIFKNKVANALIMAIILIGFVINWIFCTN